LEQGSAKPGIRKKRSLRGVHREHKKEGMKYIALCPKKPFRLWS